MRQGESDAFDDAFARQGRGRTNTDENGKTRLLEKKTRHKIELYRRSKLAKLREPDNLLCLKSTIKML
jgi:hypothetical protein